MNDIFKFFCRTLWAIIDMYSMQYNNTIELLRRTTGRMLERRMLEWMIGAGCSTVWGRMLESTTRAECSTYDNYKFDRIFESGFVLYY